MTADQKLRIVLAVVPVGIALLMAVLSAHGISSPLDDPIGMGPPT